MPMPTPYMPNPKNSACPNDSRPTYPNSRLALAANSDQIRISAITLTQNELRMRGTLQGTVSRNTAKAIIKPRSIRTRPLISRIP